MPRRLPLFALAATAFLAGCTPSYPPLPTVQSVELPRYYGTWYEIARLPNRFQAMCASDTRAEYRPDGEHVLVVNSCRTAKGTLEQAKGVAKVVEGSQGAKLRVSFFRPFYGDYWVLAREPRLDAATLDSLLAGAAALGFERQAFLTTPHTNPAR